jgi:hypothetical protein
VLEACGRQVDEIVPLDEGPLRSECIEHSSHVDGVPGHDRVGHKVQTARLIQLVLFILPSDLAFVGKKRNRRSAWRASPLLSWALMRRRYSSLSRYRRMKIVLIRVHTTFVQILSLTYYTHNCLGDSLALFCV